MKSSRISESSSSKDIESSDSSSESSNDSGSRKLMMRGGGDDDDDNTYDYSDVETLKKVDRCAGESLISQSRSNSQRSIDYVNIDETSELDGKMYLIKKMQLGYENPKTKCTGNDEDRQRSTGRPPTVENDSYFDRYNAEDSLQLRYGGDGDRDGSLLLHTDEMIAGGRSRQSQDKLQAAAPTTVAKNRKKEKEKKKKIKPAPGCNKTLAQWQQHSSENGKPSSEPFDGINKPHKYFGDVPKASIRRRRKRQIKNAYKAPGENTRTPMAVMRATDRKHEASSCINRRTANKEITRVNKIITFKILNVRTTIPKTKK